MLGIHFPGAQVDDVDEAVCQLAELYGVLHGVAGVLHDVVEQGGADGLAAQPDFAHHDAGHGDGVQDVGFARAPPDVLVGLVGEFEGALDGLHFLHVPAAGGGDLQQGVEFLVDQLVIVGCELSETHYLLSLSQAVAWYWSTFWKL